MVRYVSNRIEQAQQLEQLRRERIAQQAEAKAKPFRDKLAKLKKEKQRLRGLYYQTVYSIASQEGAIMRIYAEAELETVERMKRIVNRRLSESVIKPII